MKKTTWLLIVLCGCSVFAESNDKKISELDYRVTELEKRVLVLEKALKPFLDQQHAEKICRLQKRNARKRMQEDNKTYSRDDLRKIEKLYQVANRKWRSAEGKNSLKELVDKYQKANRTGCAYLYLGQMSKGQQQIDYLEKAIKDFSNCFYGNGVQVGAYARFILAGAYYRAGQKEKAIELLKEIKTQYPNAIDHRGRTLVAQIDENLKKMTEE